MERVRKLRLPEVSARDRSRDRDSSKDIFAPLKQLRMLLLPCNPAAALVTSGGFGVRFSKCDLLRRRAASNQGIMLARHGAARNGKSSKLRRSEEKTGSQGSSGSGGSGMNDLAEMKVYELKALCRAKNLKVTGNKADLIKRVTAALQAQHNQEQQQPPPCGTNLMPSVTDALVSSQHPSTAGVSAAMVSTSVPDTEVTVHEVEVLDTRESQMMDDRAYVAERRAKRRARLSQYFNEEFSSVVGELEARAGSLFATSVDQPSVWKQALSTFGVNVAASPASSSAETVESRGSSSTEQYIDATRSSGRRLAWCREFDENGRGVIIDLEDRSEWIVDRNALEVNAPLDPGRRTLHAGEFVEYDPASARELASGSEPDGGWVRGIMGWPLMCEASVAPAKNSPAAAVDIPTITLNTSTISD